MIQEDLVYLVSIVNVDTHIVRYVCDSETKAMEMFEDLRKECIEECKEMINYYGEEKMWSFATHEQEKIAFLKTMKSGDIPPWCCDRPAIEVFPFLQTKRDTPTSKELVSLAEHDWHNREERKHKHPMPPWVSGWITGFLTPTKPDWSKEREKKVRRETIEEYRNELKKELGKGMDYIDWDSVEAVYIRLGEKK